MGDPVPAAGAPPRAVVLVEGESDRVAVLALARRQGRDLQDEGVVVVPMGGVTNIARFLTRYGPPGSVQLAGLYDVADSGHVRRGLAKAGLDAAQTGDLEAFGFFACDLDLEDELIRALGLPAVEAVIDAAGEARSLALLSGMPAQRDWTRRAVLRRFLGVRSGRKARYAALLVDALDLQRPPRPLAALLARV